MRNDLYMEYVLFWEPSRIERIQIGDNCITFINIIIVIVVWEISALLINGSTSELSNISANVVEPYFKTCIK